MGWWRGKQASVPAVPLTLPQRSQQRGDAARIVPSVKDMNRVRPISPWPSPAPGPSASIPVCLLWLALPFWCWTPRTHATPRHHRMPLPKRWLIVHGRGQRSSLVGAKRSWTRFEEPCDLLVLLLAERWNLARLHCPGAALRPLLGASIGAWSPARIPGIPCIPCPLLPSLETKRLPEIEAAPPTTPLNAGLEELGASHRLHLSATTTHSHVPDGFLGFRSGPGLNAGTGATVLLPLFVRFWLRACAVGRTLGQDVMVLFVCTCSCRWRLLAGFEPSMDELQVFAGQLRLCSMRVAVACKVPYQLQIP